MGLAGWEELNSSSGVGHAPSEAEKSWLSLRMTIEELEMEVARELPGNCTLSSLSQRVPMPPCDPHQP